MSRIAQTEVWGYASIMASVTAILRAALKNSGTSRYSVSIATGIPESTLCRFLQGTPMRGENIDRLAEHLSMTLTAKPDKTKRKGR